MRIRARKSIRGSFLLKMLNVEGRAGSSQGGRGEGEGSGAGTPPQVGGQYLLGSWAARARLEPGLSSPAGLQKQGKQRKMKQFGARSAPENCWDIWGPKARKTKENEAFRRAKRAGKLRYLGSKSKEKQRKMKHSGTRVAPGEIWDLERRSQGSGDIGGRA